MFLQNFGMETNTPEGDEGLDNADAFQMDVDLGKLCIGLSSCRSFG